MTLARRRQPGFGTLKVTEAFHRIDTVHPDMVRIKQLTDGIVKELARVSHDPEQDFQSFSSLFFQPNALIFEIGTGEGVVTVFNISPPYFANVGMEIWGPIVRNRGKRAFVEAMREFQKYLFWKLKVHRLQTLIPVSDLFILKIIERAGWKREGCLREACRYKNGKWYDKLVYALLNETENSDG